MCRKISEEGDRIFFKTKQLFADRDSKKLVAKSDDSFDFIKKAALIRASKGSTNDLVIDDCFTY